MLGALTKGVAGALKKPKQSKKIDPKKFAGQVEETKANAKGGALVPQPQLSIIKIVDVKVGAQKKSTKGPFETLRERTHDLWKALRRESKAKKIRAKKKKVNEQKKKRNYLENLRESAVGKFAAGATTKLTSPVAGFFETLIKAIALIFAGWLMNYLPQILEFIKGFIGIVQKIIALAKPIVLGILAVGTWITDKGVKLIAMLVGIKPDEALNNSIIKNITEIQKRIPLIEAAFAAFAVFSTLKVLGIGGGKPPRGTPKGSQAQRLRQTGQGGNRFNSMRRRLRTSSATKQVRNRFARRFGAQAARRRFTGQVAGRVVGRGQKLMTGLRAGASKSKALLGKLGKFAKLPVIGGLIVAVTQLIAGEPLGKALFMGVGAGLGGILGGLIGAAGGPLAVVGAILGEMLGTFVGELLYEGFMGKGWGAAGEKLKGVLVGIWDKMLAPLGKWIGGVFGRFVEKFKEENKLPKWMGGGTNWLQIINPIITTPLLFKAFFSAPKDEKVKDVKDEKDDEVKNEENKSADAIKPGDSSSKSKDADAISESASYDKPGAGGGGGTIMPVNIQQMQGGGSGGGVSSRGGSASTLNTYEITNTYKKALTLARFYRD